MYGDAPAEPLAKLWMACTNTQTVRSAPGLQRLGDDCIHKVMTFLAVSDAHRGAGASARVVSDGENAPRAPGAAAADAGAAIRAEALRLARLRREQRAANLSIAAAKRALAGSEPASLWRKMGLADRVLLEREGDRSVRLGVRGAKGRVFVDVLMRIDGRRGLAECPAAPAVVTGLVDAWPALREDWSLEGLARRFGDAVAFEVDGGPGEARRSMGSAKVSLKEYARYCGDGSDGDDAPLYVFEPRAGVPAREQLEPTPACFVNDALPGLLGSRDEKKRPLPRAWLLVSSKRSGTPVHDHPLTAAWNVLLHGTKLWVALPPGACPHAALLLEHGDEFSACEWFLKWGDCALPRGSVVIVQRPREVVVLPAGWWHVVLNVEDSVALSMSLALARDFAFLETGAATQLERDRLEALHEARS